MICDFHHVLVAVLILNICMILTIETRVNMQIIGGTGEIRTRNGRIDSALSLPGDLGSKFGTGSNIGLLHLPAIVRCFTIKLCTA